MAKEKVQVEHKDRLGRVVKVDDIVAFPSHNSLEIGVIANITPKMVLIKRVPATSYSREWRKYSHETVLIEGADLTMYLLTAK